MTSPISHKLLMTCIVVSLLSGVTAGYIGNYLHDRQKSTNEMIREHYESENAVMVSPSTLKKRMDAKDDTFILIDLRSKGEYDKEHILGAINIPAVSMTKEQIVSEFKKLPNDKELIVHCYSMVCMLGRQTGKLLAENGVYVKELGIGWSEWKYYWGLWNPGEDPEKGKAYITASSEAEKNKPAPMIAPCVAGEFGC